MLQVELRRLRKRAGVSQADLALLLHKPQSYISKYENGERKLDILEVNTICKALGTSLSEFVEQLTHALNDSARKQ